MVESNMLTGKTWVRYKNGNYMVSINLKDGTKIRANNLDHFTPDFPESMDLKITDYCDMGCVFCLKPSAKLNIEGEAKTISEVQIGDKVLSANLQNNKLEYRPILRFYQRPYKGKLYTITDQFGHKLTCTPNHKVYTQNRGFIRADELTTNDLLVIE